MQLTTVVLSLFAAAASAGCVPRDTAPRKFGIMSLRSASPVHFGTAGASKNKLVLNLPEDQLDAECTDGVARRDAVFYIKDGELYLYGPEDGKVQSFFTDRSGMGQGVLQYYNKGEQGLGRNFEVKGWALDENDNLTFNGSGLIACPSEDGPWYVWVSAGVNKPAGQEGCLGFSARTIDTVEPVQCTYSSYSA
ncbi:hypothetical protein QBC40DRAFT_26311 [Triangularia verruculosa]|uniref:Cell wall protein PhiA n=1 Tax=Triangularia verruculosa TaxID=2587418 RepID=A0AAN7AQ12_9PEZI|nr:hypothetical protein QBC40DRAFT_26311 [Triangularia verruculosa]